jgi:hypothetical protein
MPAYQPRGNRINKERLTDARHFYRFRECRARAVSVPNAAALAEFSRNSQPQHPSDLLPPILVPRTSRSVGVGRTMPS